MDFKPETCRPNLFESNMFDSIDCPQKLDCIEEAKVDDSWFFRQQSESGADSKISLGLTCSEPCTSNDFLTDKLSVIEEDTAVTSAKTAASVSQSDYENSESAAGGPRLATESRCQQRSKWETLRIQRERHHEQLRQQRKDSLCRREQQQIQQLRAASVPKAQPIRHYKPMRIHRSEKPLTVAKSPDFALSKRLRQRSQQSDE